MRTTHRYTVLLEPQAGGGFTVRVPVLPEVVTEGEAEDDALAMARDAIALVLAQRRDEGLPVPPDAAPVVRRVAVAAG